MDLVSIITPCYNSASFLPKMIESVIVQTYPYWELIIVDDCSTDRSGELIKYYASQDSRIKYYRLHKPSGSPTKPRNYAIDKAQGRYIAFLDSDDLWLPNKLYNQVQLFHTNSNVAVVYSNYEKMDERGTRNHRVIISPKSLSYKQLLYGNSIGNLTGIYDTKKVEKIFFDYVGHEDYVMWLNILKKGYIALNTNTVEAIYRVRNNSVSSNKFKSLKWTWNVYFKIEKLGAVSSMYHFIFYAFKALIKISK